VWTSPAVREFAVRTDEHGEAPEIRLNVLWFPLPPSQNIVTCPPLGAGRMRTVAPFPWLRAASSRAAGAGWLAV
jgi:hypothetical protein